MLVTSGDEAGGNERKHTYLLYSIGQQPTTMNEILIASQLTQVIHTLKIND